MKKVLPLAFILSASLAMAQNNPLLNPQPSGTNRTPTSPPPPGGVQLPAPMATGPGVRTSLFQQGMVFIGGRTNLSFRKSTTKVSGSPDQESPTMSFGLAPRLGFYFADDLAVGGMISYDWTRDTDKGTGGSPDQKTTSSEFGIGGFLRYANSIFDYYDCCHTLGYFLDFGVGYGRGSSKFKSGSTTTDGDDFSRIHVGFTPGIIFFPTPRLGLEAGIGGLLDYSATTTNSPDEGSTSPKRKRVDSSFDVFNLNSLSLSLGFNYYLNAGK